MKKIKFEKKLSLNKKTIAKLNNEQMKEVKGGSTICFTPTSMICTQYCVTATCEIVS